MSARSEPVGRVPSRGAAPTGRKTKAQGNGLGNPPPNTATPEGAKEASQLPRGWRWATLGEVTESMKNGIYKPASAYADDGLACLRMYNIGDGKVAWRDIKRMRLDEAEIREYELLPGDLLVNRVNSRELVGKAVAIPRGLERCVFESKNIRVRIRRDLVSPEFVSYRLLSEGSRYFTQNAQQVVGMASISQPQVARFPLPLPPLPEQRRIVAEIEKQFTRLEAGVAALRRVQANLKRYRAAVLKAACCGRLVPTEVRVQKAEGRSVETGEQLLKRILAERRKQWEESNRKSKIGNRKYREPAAPALSAVYSAKGDTAILPPLPESWTWASVEQLLVEPMCNGISIKGSDDPPGVRTLRLSAMSNAGFDYSDARYLPLDESDVDDLWIQSSDFFVSRGNGSLHLVGRGTLAQTAPTPTIFPDTMIRLRLADSTRGTRWLSSIWPSYVIRSQIERMVKTTAGIYKIAQPQVGQIAIPLPPLEEQTRIVAEVERRLSVVEELESVVSANLQRAARLRQSILQKAFAGALV
jgi:type I restriction enzyme, S subunit